MGRSLVFRPLRCCERILVVFIENLLGCPNGKPTGSREVDEFTIVPTENLLDQRKTYWINGKPLFAGWALGPEEILGGNPGVWWVGVEG